jgi:hypothetical protein
MLRKIRLRSILDRVGAKAPGHDHTFEVIVSDLAGALIEGGSNIGVHGAEGLHLLDCLLAVDILGRQLGLELENLDFKVVDLLVLFHILRLELLDGTADLLLLILEELQLRETSHGQGKSDSLRAGSGEELRRGIVVSRASHCDEMLMELRYDGELCELGRLRKLDELRHKPRESVEKDGERV